MTVKNRALAAALTLIAAGGLSVVAAAPASAASLSCTARTYNTAGSATCTGTGSWRIRLDCASQSDYVGPWIDQNGGSVQQSGQCRFDNRRTSVEQR